MKNVLNFVCLLAVCAVPLCAQDDHRIYYLRSAAAPPWNVTSNERDMTDVFGESGWRDRRYETVDPNRLFKGNVDFIFMEGGDNNATALQSFLSTYSSQIAAWVSNGGRLFINAAPNQGTSIDMGFGVTLNFNMDYSTSSNNAASVVDNPIFNGPVLPVGTAFTASDSFSHGYLTGDGLIPLIQDDQGRAVLAQMQVGNGLVLFGGMTVDIFQSPWPNTHNLRENIIYYTATAHVN
jgi:hypothetical protein